MQNAIIITRHQTEWTCGDSNPEFLRAKEVCSHYYYTPLGAAPAGIEPAISGDCRRAHHYTKEPVRCTPHSRAVC